MYPTSPVLPLRNKFYSKVPEVVYAKDQPEYTPLPAVRTVQGEVITRWKLTFRERLVVLFSGNIWLNLLTFNNPLQPIKLSVIEPEVNVITNPTR